MLEISRMAREPRIILSRVGHGNLVKVENLLGDDWRWVSGVAQQLSRALGSNAK